MNANKVRVRQALETWRLHRRAGTMPPIRTMETIVGAARTWLNEPCRTCDGTGCAHTEDKMEHRVIAGAEDPCCPDC